MISAIPARRCPFSAWRIKAPHSIPQIATLPRPGCWAIWPSAKPANFIKSWSSASKRCSFFSATFPMNRDCRFSQSLPWSKIPTRLDPVRKDIEQTIKQFQTKLVSEKELDDVKRHDKYAFLDRLDTPDHVAEALVRYIAVTGGIEALDLLYAALRPRHARGYSPRSE